MPIYDEQEIRRISVNAHVDIADTTSPHHAQSHAITSTSDHTVSGLASGQAFEATGATTFGFVARQLRAHKPSDESRNTTTTLATDTDLSLTLAASSIYLFRIVGFIACAGATEGFKAAVGGTVGVTSLKGQVKIYDDSLAAPLVSFRRIEALDTSVEAAALPIGDHYFEIEGAIETSTAGTFFLSWAQETSGANNTTVERNSSMVATLV